MFSLLMLLLCFVYAEQILIKDETETIVWLLCISKIIGVAYPTICFDETDRGIEIHRLNVDSIFSAFNLYEFFVHSELIPFSGEPVRFFVISFLLICDAPFISIGYPAGKLDQLLEID